MNIFLRELKANRKALIIWCVCMILGVLSGMSKYTVYSSGGASNQAINELPRTMKALFGMGDFDVTKMGGFFAFLFLYIEVAAAIHAVLLGSGIVAKEERDKTTEFLISKPVSRSRIITAKLFAGLFNIVVLNIVTLVSSIAMVSAYNKGKDITGEIMVFFLSMLIVQLIFFSLGALLAAVLNHPKSAGSIAAGILFGSFIIDEITNLNDRLDILNLLSPFKYFSYARIVEGKGLSVGIVLLCAALIFVFCGSTYFFYQKRDLNV